MYIAPRAKMLENVSGFVRYEEYAEEAIWAMTHSLTYVWTAVEVADLLRFLQKCASTTKHAI